MAAETAWRNPSLGSRPPRSLLVALTIAGAGVVGCAAEAPADDPSDPGTVDAGGGVVEPADEAAAGIPGVAPGPRRPVAPTDDDPRLRVMTYNIRRDGSEDAPQKYWDNRRDVVASILERGDIIGVQEAKSGQYDFLRSRLGADFDAVRGAVASEVTGQYNPVLYRKDRFVVLESDTEWYASPSPDLQGVLFTYGGCTKFLIESRSILFVHFQAVGTHQRFWFVNTHMPQQKEKTHSCLGKFLSARIAAHAGTSEPVIVVGDFNDIPSMSAETGEGSRYYWTRFASAPLVFSDARDNLAAWQPTFVDEEDWGRVDATIFSGQPIDQILFRGFARASEAVFTRIDQRNTGAFADYFPSDHLPSMMEIPL